MTKIKKNSIFLMITAIMLYGAAYSNPDTDNFDAAAPEIKKTYSIEQIQLDKKRAAADYIAKSRRKIKNNWYPPTTSFEHTATIIVTLDHSGKLLNCAIKESSSDEGFDNSLIEAVQKTKFSPLPDEIKSDSVDIDFTFNMQKVKITK